MRPVLVSEDSFKRNLRAGELIRVNRSFDYRVAFFEYIYSKEVVKIAREILRIACFFSFD